MTVRYHPLATGSSIRGGRSLLSSYLGDLHIGDVRVSETSPTCGTVRPANSPGELQARRAASP